MTAIETYPGRGELYCGHCDLTIGGNEAKTPDELTALMDGSEHARLKEENAKLREQVVRLQADWESERDYANQMEAKEKRAVSENAKLRELADAVKDFVEDTHCEDCPCRRDCDDNNRIFCVNDFSYHAFAAMRELGIEA